MATLPTEKEVTAYVIDTIAAFIRRSASAITPQMELAKPPLKLDPNQLTFLSMSLRAYIRVHNAAATVTVSDTKKDKQTVGGISTVVYSRIVERT